MKTQHLLGGSLRSTVFSLGSITPPFSYPLAWWVRALTVAGHGGRRPPLVHLPVCTYVSISPSELSSRPHLSVLPAAESPNDPPDCIAAVPKYKLSIVSLLCMRETRKSSISMSGL